MITYTSALSTLQQLTKVQTTDTTNSSLLIQFWNDSRRTVASINGGKWPWLEIEEEVDTVANQEYVEIPNKIRRVVSVRQENGSSNVVVYLPKLIFDPTKWDLIIASKLGTSDVPYFVYQREERLYIQPIPSGVNTIKIRGRIDIRDVNIIDYSTGTIVSIANGATTVTGTGTSWTASMAGRWIRITESDTINKGDGYWYEISSVTSGTILELKKPYQGTSISAGSAAYTLGQITYEPEAYQMAPIYRATAQWLQINDPLHPERYNMYWRQYDGGVEAGLSTQYGGLIGQMLQEAGESMEGPYIPPDGNRYDNGIPYWYPYDLGTGFN